MKSANSYKKRLLPLEIILLIVGLVFIAPFYFLLVNSVKSFGEILQNAASFPSIFQWENYSKAWQMMDFPRAFWNSLTITVIANILLALISGMAAYRMVRRNTRFNKTLFMVYVAAMVVPFQSIMIPLIKVVNWFGLSNSMLGLLICYLGMGTSLCIFLFHGFVKSIPLEIEEAAVVDGCTPYGVFFKIVLPLMKPMAVTIIILNALWIWNDYLLPSLILQDEDLHTIPLATFGFFGQYTNKWDLALPALAMGIAPIVIFYLALQKYIVEGVAAGSVKG
ncbi:carbohydrate ABC transporter permease [Marinicrinis lubricantis]|uniref:Carbohydrate ABC transporter permease n=1 Tax=Marinicrinis lubricantis TaxID=2086470 RepID=A0ABW1IJY3_9BACL